MKRWRTSSTRRGNAPLLGTLCALALLSALLSMCLGAVALTPGEVVSALLGGGRDTAAQIVRYARLPRTCACLLAGAALAVSGAVIQTVLNNPLASPGIIGVNSSAGLAVALACAAFPWAQGFTPFIAFAGALTGALLVLALAQGARAARTTVVLAGVAVSNLFSAGIDAVITLVPDALNGVTDFRVGGFSGVTMARLAPAAGVIAVSLTAALSLSRQMDILSLGGDTARSLGLSVRPVRLALLALAAALAGAAVSFVGLLGFVGLIAPHIARRLAGEDSSARLLLAAALGGAALLTLCDVLARTLFAPYELPVGVVLSLLGGPFFLWLLVRQRHGPGRRRKEAGHA